MYVPSYLIRMELQLLDMIVSNSTIEEALLEFLTGLFILSYFSVVLNYFANLHSNDNMRGLSCLMYSNTDSEDIVFIGGSGASHIFIFDIRSARVLKEVKQVLNGL